MKTRIEYRGGPDQISRMNEDKLKSLKSALLYSYQSATAVLPGDRDFKCLINKNKLSVDLDEKIISIPFEDYCLNKKENQQTNIKEGDVIEWKENGSHWLVYLQRLEETAYFRANMRRCRYEVTLDNGKKYHVSVKGPTEQSILWMQGGGNYINKLNYSLVMYISQTEETLDYFHRFTKVKINNQPWEVQAVDSISTPGIIVVSLKETFTNTPKDDIETAVKDSIDIFTEDEKEEVYISGEDEIYPYDVKEYEIKNYSGGGSWEIQNFSRPGIVKIISQDENRIKLSVTTGRTGSFELAYFSKTIELVAALEIGIKSL